MKSTRQQQVEPPMRKEYDFRKAEVGKYTNPGSLNPAVFATGADRKHKEHSRTVQPNERRAITLAIGMTRYPTGMSRREEWRKVLESEAGRWSALSSEQLLSQLRDVQAYEVELDSKKYQVEVELLENTDQYVHVMVAVDDGSLPASIAPLSQTFLCQKPLPAERRAPGWRADPSGETGP